MILVGICGGTGSGKSTITNKIVEYFKKKGIVKIQSDSYYKSESNFDFKKRSKINFDHPDSIDFKFLLKNLSELKNNKKIKEPIYSYKSHKRLKKNKVVYPKKIIIIEGLHIFCNKKLINLIDYGIYLDVNDKVRLKRRIDRDVNFRGRKTKEVEERYFMMCKPMHEKYIEPSKEYADIVLKSKDISFQKVLSLISKKIIC